MVFAFEFQEAYYSDEEYITGNVVDKSNRPVPKEQWSFAIVESVFDMIKGATGNQSTTYILFGHSAGAQFVHRYVLFNPASRFSTAIAANAGWYTMPDLEVAFPYGLKNTSLTKTDIMNASQRDLIVLLGTNDTNPNDAALRKTPEANLQGEHRYARGLYFYNQSKQSAEKQEYEYKWTLREVPGVGHDGVALSKAAANLLFFGTN
jgi:pimeloyl-ACP methyl ester carboxylesterase